MEKISVRESLALHLLRQILVKHKIPINYYSLGSYSDDAFCVEKIDGNWICYIGSRGCRCNIQKFSSVKWACVCVIDSVSESYELEAVLLKKFLKEFDLSIHFKHIKLKKKSN